MPAGVTDIVAVAPSRALLRHVDGHVALATWTDGGRLSLTRVARRPAEKSAELNAELAEIASALPPATAVNSTNANLAISSDLAISADLAVSAGDGSFGARVEISRLMNGGSGLVLMHPRDNDGGAMPTACAMVAGSHMNADVTAGAEGVEGDTWKGGVPRGEEEVTRGKEEVTRGKEEVTRGKEGGGDGMHSPLLVYATPATGSDTPAEMQVIDAD